MTLAGKANEGQKVELVVDEESRVQASEVGLGQVLEHGPELQRSVVVLVV